jgi:hypothetical protein
MAAVGVATASARAPATARERRNKGTYFLMGRKKQYGRQAMGEFSKGQQQILRLSRPLNPMWTGAA